LSISNKKIIWKFWLRSVVQCIIGHSEIQVYASNSANDSGDNVLSWALLDFKILSLPSCLVRIIGFNWMLQ